MKKILLGLVMTLIMTANGYANEIEIKKIKDKHDAYYTYLFENDMNNLAKLFIFPAVFKGFVNEVQIAKNEKDIKNIYENLIKAAPQSKFVNESRNYTEITTKVENKSIYKMRDDTDMIIVKYTQSDKKDNSLIFSGRASYLFIKDDEEWLISGVF